MIKFRFANVVDIIQLAEIHIETGVQQPGGFMHKLGLSFMKRYYSILLSEKYSIVIVAENENGVIIGFCSGTLEAAEHLLKLKKNKFKLLISLIPQILKNPKLLPEIILRYKHISGTNESVLFNNKDGVRNEYWAWRDGFDRSKSTHLFKTWLNIVFSFGYESVKGEVDSVNKHIVLFHKILGAKILNETKMPDGRIRYFVEYKKSENKIHF